MPSYFHDALGLTFNKVRSIPFLLTLSFLMHFQDIIYNGIFSGIPYIGFFISSIVAGLVADYLRQKNLVSTKNVRKGITTLGKS